MAICDSHEKHLLTATGDCHVFAQSVSLCCWAKERSVEGLHVKGLYNLASSANL